MVLMLPRFGDSIYFYYVIFGCAVTSLYFIFSSDLSALRRTSKVNYGNVSGRNYQYEEVCREWKLALQQEKALNKRAKLENKVPEPKADDFDIFDDGFSLSSHFDCDNSFKQKHIAQRGQYYVIYNFVRAEKDFGCTESITLSAPGDFRFLDNVIPLVDRWRGPISIALYAPGQDFFTTSLAIAYLRNCQADLIRKLVTFHVFFDQAHTPRHNGSTIINSYKDEYDCTAPPPWKTVKDKDMYKTRYNLLYPINTARNVAKVASQTYFVFPSDIELYPTRDFIPQFLKFVTENLELFAEGTKNVFVLPVFEILADQWVPENKTQLQSMLKNKTAIIFHEHVCIVCHRVIESEKWIKENETEGLGVFSVGQRIGRHMVWEPFFVCTQKEPLWDERMTWEGQNNKMVQAFTMCVLKYDFHVLDNAFLIHKPGVKKTKVQNEKFQGVVTNTVKLIKKVAVELQELYGYNKNCSTTYSYRDPAKTTKKPTQSASAVPTKVVKKP